MVLLRLGPGLVGAAVRIYSSHCEFTLRVHAAGLDLLTVGIARTEMYTAVFDALNGIGVEYTLPPVKNNGAAGPDTSATVQPSAAVAARRYAGAQQHDMQQAGAADDAMRERAAVAQQALLLG